ncbi:nuclear transport factor 2 family protein [Brevundimonas sp.]|uniref:nuclear transport factor 2 family protein n=1 Tax=Brevundimonas sp. TaxID=1871086 RepID=UPI0025BD0FC1|nr:nuclear transport factor 2 family protein [Brevundimonas sp.]
MSLTAALFAAVLMQAAPDPAAAEVADVLDRLNAASSSADAQAYFGLFTPEARFVGTDASEHWTVDELRAYARAAFDSGRGWSYPATDRVITIADIDCRCIAWFEEKLTNANYGETRGSGVMRKTADGWKIEQYVLSFAVPNDRAEAVVAAVRNADAD